MAGSVSWRADGNRPLMLHSCRIGPVGSKPNSTASDRTRGTNWSGAQSSSTLDYIGLVLFVSQALVAIATVEMVQYFEHYGLVRKDGEPLAAGHVWNSNGWLTNAITLNITRRSHQHLDARVPYQGLRVLRDGPTMPAGYFGLAWLALFPPLWRWGINKQLPATTQSE